MTTNPRTKIPNLQWSAAYVDRMRMEDSGQKTGCVHCALSGSAEIPQTIYMIAGTSVCANHILQEVSGE